MTIPETILWSEVILLAVDDVSGGACDLPQDKRDEARRDALEWLSSDDVDCRQF